MEPEQSLHLGLLAIQGVADIPGCLHEAAHPRVEGTHSSAVNPPRDAAADRLRVLEILLLETSQGKVRAIRDVLVRRGHASSNRTKRHVRVTAREAPEANLTRLHWSEISALSQLHIDFLDVCRTPCSMHVV